MKNIPFRVLVQFMCLTLLLAGPAYAEMGTNIKTTVDISIMPEYDTSDVLVLNTITFINSSGQAYSGEMRFPVPKGTTNNIVKETNSTNDSHLTVRVEDKGDHAEFVWQPSQPIQPNATYPIHLEYYYNPIPGTGNKSFDFIFQPSYTVDRANVQIYQPLKSTNLVTVPPTQSLGADNQGFQLYGTNFTGVKPNQNISLKISYNKTDANPSVQPQTQQDGGGADQLATKGQFGSMAVLVPLAVLAIFGLIVLKKAMDKGEIEELDSADDEEEITVKPTEKKKTSIKSTGKKQDFGSTKLMQEKKRLRNMLMNGEIGEATYHELLAELEEEYR